MTYDPARSSGQPQRAIAPAATPTRAAGIGSLKGKSLPEQTALVAPGTTPLKPSNQQAGEVKGPARRELATRRLQKWYTDAGNALQDLRNQMGRAGDRFADFAGSGIRKLKATADILGTFASLLFGVPGKVAQALGKILVAAYAKEPGGKIKAALARELDDQKRAGDADVQTRYQGYTSKLDAAGNDAELGAVQAEIERIRINPVPDENMLYRDLILQMVDDAGMQVDGSDWNQRNRGKYYTSWDWGNPFGMDGHDVAGELNKLGTMDPKTKQPFRSQARP